VHGVVSDEELIDLGNTGISRQLFDRWDGSNEFGVDEDDLRYVGFEFEIYLEPKPQEIVIKL